MLLTALEVRSTTTEPKRTNDPLTPPAASSITSSTNPLQGKIYLRIPRTSQKCLVRKEIMKQKEVTQQKWKGTVPQPAQHMKMHRPSSGCGIRTHAGLTEPRNCSKPRLVVVRRPPNGDNTRIRTETANARYGLASGKDAAAICAISINFGAVGDRFASASRNIVLQNGHAAPTTSAPVSISSLARV